MKIELNPVLKRELITFQRGWKLPLGIFFFNLFLLLILSFYQMIKQLSPVNSGVDLNAMKSVYYAFMYCELILILLIVPAVTSSSISGERQRGTLDILLVSAKSYHQIITGKLLSGILIVGLIVVSSLPFYAVIGIYGGVGFKEMAMNLLFYLIIALFYGALGLLNSVLFNKNNVSIIMTYLAVFANSVVTLIGTLMITSYMMVGSGASQQPGQIAGLLTYFNPFVFIMTMLDVQMGTNVNLLATFKNYNPVMSLIIMGIVHLLATVLIAFVATRRLRSRQ